MNQMTTSIREKTVDGLSLPKELEFNNPPLKLRKSQLKSLCHSLCVIELEA